MSIETDRVGAEPLSEPLSEEEEDRLYPGDVEEAMPEGELSYELANYVKVSVTRLSADLERDSVHANMPMYYQRGTRKLVAPDVFFARGVPFDRRRKSWRLWKAKVPDVVFEIVSMGHEKKDVEVNRFLFEKLGIGEYYWFDPETETLAALELDPASKKYRERKPNAAGRYESEALGLEVGVKDGLLALYDEGEYVPHPIELLDRFQRERDEAARERDVALRALEDERRRREELEARLRELEARS